MPTYTYAPVRRGVTRRVTCPVCGKKRTVRHTVQQTVNPYHSAVRALGPDYDYEDAWDAVHEAVRAEAEAWQPSARKATHQKCQETD